MMVFHSACQVLQYRASPNEGDNVSAAAPLIISNLSLLVLQCASVVGSLHSLNRALRFVLSMSYIVETLKNL